MILNLKCTGPSAFEPRVFCYAEHMQYERGVQYESALVYDAHGNFRGNVILKNIAGGTARLQSVNIWTDSERADLDDQLARLNSLISIKAHWPRQDDPDVQALLSNPEWNPVELEASEEVDEDESYIVYHEEDGTINGTIDYDASVIVPKTVMVPSRTGVAARIRLAMETVATERANK